MLAKRRCPHTGIVNFFSDVGRDDSGWLRSKGKSVSVPSGTVLAFAIVVLPDGPAKP